MHLPKFYRIPSVSICFRKDDFFSSIDTTGQIKLQLLSRFLSPKCNLTMITAMPIVDIIFGEMNNIFPPSSSRPNEKFKWYFERRVKCRQNCHHPPFFKGSVIEIVSTTFAQVIIYFLDPSTVHMTIRVLKKLVLVIICMNYMICSISYLWKVEERSYQWAFLVDTSDLSSEFHSVSKLYCQGQTQCI